MIVSNPQSQNYLEHILELGKPDVVVFTGNRRVEYVNEQVFWVSRGTPLLELEPFVHLLIRVMLTTGMSQVKSWYLTNSGSSCDLLFKNVVLTRDTLIVWTCCCKKRVVCYVKTRFVSGKLTSVDKLRVILCCLCCSSMRCSPETPSLFEHVLFYKPSVSSEIDILD